MKFLILFFTVLMAVGCSKNASLMGETLSTAFFPDSASSVDYQMVESVPYASLKAELDNHYQMLLVLGEAEKNHKQDSADFLKWVSSDNETLITANGRIVKTVALGQGNLLSIASEQKDPLSFTPFEPKLISAQKWQYLLSWQPGNYIDIPAVSTFQYKAKETIKPWNTSILTHHIVENVSIPSLKLSYDNHYWFLDNGELIKSKQYLYPGSLPITLTVGRPYSGVQ